MDIVAYLKYDVKFTSVWVYFKYKTTKWVDYTSKCTKNATTSILISKLLVYL